MPIDPPNIVALLIAASAVALTGLGLIIVRRITGNTTLTNLGEATNE